MEVRNTTYQALQQALEDTNEHFAGNIRFKTLNSDGFTRNHFPKFLLTLTVVSSQAPGHRLSASPFYPHRHVAAACWHVHQQFLLALAQQSPDVEVISTLGKWHANEPFLDANIGSQIYPILASEACECDQD